MQINTQAAAKAEMDAFFEEIDQEPHEKDEHPIPSSKKPPPRRPQNSTSTTPDKSGLSKSGANASGSALDEVVEEITPPLLELSFKRRALNLPLDLAERELFGRIAQHLYEDDESLFHKTDPTKRASLNKISNRLWQAGLDYKPHTVRRRILAYFVAKWFAARGVAPVQQLRNSVLLELDRLRKHPEAAIEFAAIAAEKGLSKRRVYDMVVARLHDLEAGTEDSDGENAREANAPDPERTGDEGNQPGHGSPEPAAIGDQDQHDEQQPMAGSSSADNPKPKTARSNSPQTSTGHGEDQHDEISSLVMPVVELFEELFRDESKASYQRGIEALATQLKSLAAARDPK